MHSRWRFRSRPIRCRPTKGQNFVGRPDLSSIKLIDYDFKKYGSSAERKRLLKKWDDEVYAQ